MKMIFNIEREVFQMPGGDRTGPWGRGPMTGRAAGCLLYTSLQYRKRSAKHEDRYCWRRPGRF